MRTFFNSTYSRFAKPYWKMKGGAFERWYGIGNLDHWLIPKPLANRGGKLIKGLGHSGLNLVEIPASINQVMGMRGWAPRWAQIGMRTLVTTSVPAVALVGGYAGYVVGKNASVPSTDCECQ